MCFLCSCRFHRCIAVVIGCCRLGQPIASLAERIEPVGRPPRICASQSSSVFMCARKASPPGKRAHRPADVLARACARRRIRRTGCSGRAGARSASAWPGAPRAAAAPRRWPGSARCRRRSTAAPCAARPIMIASAPVRASTSAALRGESMSPLATTGMRRRDLTVGDGVVLGLALVALLARAAVHGDHRDAGAFGGAREPHRIALRRRTSRCASSASPARRAARRRRPPPR